MIPDEVDRLNERIGQLPDAKRACVERLVSQLEVSGIRQRIEELPPQLVQDGLALLEDVLAGCTELMAVVDRWQAQEDATITVLNEVAPDDLEQAELRWAIYTGLPVYAAARVLGALAHAIAERNGGETSPLTVEEMRRVAGDAGLEVGPGARIL